VTENIHTVTDEHLQNAACNSDYIQSSGDPNRDLPPYYKFVDDTQNLSDRGVPLDDIEYVVKILKKGVSTLSDYEIHHFLTHSWKPRKQDEFPVSYHNK
jgi:hypothetical protein